MDLAAQRLRHALSPALWGFPAVASTVYGIDETADECTNTIIVKLANDMGVEISEQELSVSHRLGRKTGKPRLLYLFLCHINDLPLSVDSKIRLFADDCLIYREINSIEDKVQLQKDLDSLQDWAVNWGMRFNAQKCYILSTATARKQTPYFYQLNGEILQSVPNTPYLGVTLSTDLKFNIHLNKNIAKSYQCLAFVRRNLKYCPEKLRRLSYISLIRSKLEYSSSVWDPHLRKDIHQLEMVQRRAARFIKHDYSYDSSVSQMLKDLDLSSLENRRKMNKLTLLYKIRNNLLCIKENGYLERADSRTRDASRNYKLKSAKSELYKHSFFINTPKIWNKLPSVIKDTQSLEHFKTAVRQHYQ